MPFHRPSLYVFKGRCVGGDASNDSTDAVQARLEEITDVIDSVRVHRLR